MGGQTSGRTMLTMDDWMRDQERRVLHESRRPSIHNAAALMGPGLAAHTVQIDDWNDDITAFNGFFYSEPGARNSPDVDKFWMGYVLANDENYGYMRVYEYRPEPDAPDIPIVSYVRTFAALSGSLRTFGQWRIGGAGGGLGGGGVGRLDFNEVTTNNAATSANATPVDIDGLTVTFTAKAGHAYRIHMNLNLRSDTPGARIGAFLREGSTVLQQWLQQSQPTNVQDTRAYHFDIEPSEGVHTYKASFALLGGTGIISHIANIPYVGQIAVDDVTVGDPGSGTAGAVQFIAETGRRFKFFSGTVRNDGSGWAWIDDSGHRQSGFDPTVVVNSDNIELVFANPMLRVSSLQVTPDETWGQLGLRAGTSVGLTSAKIYLYREPWDRISDYVEYNGTTFVSSKGVFTPSFAASVLTLTHENMGSEIQWGVALANRGNAVAQAGGISDTTTTISFYTGTFGSLTAVSSPTAALCRVWVTRFGRRRSVPAENPATVIAAFGNLWVTGWMEV